MRTSGPPGTALGTGVPSDLAADAAALRRASTALAARARAQRRGDLTLTEVAVLGRIATHGPLTPREVAGQLRMLPQSLTRPLAALQGRGLVDRTPDPADGRGALLRATARGLEELAAEMAPRDRWVAEAIASSCTAAERRLLARASEVMQRLAEHGGDVAPVER